MLVDLTGRTALVTGAAQGIGRGIALVMAQQGADVVIADLDADLASQTAKEITKLGRKALGVQTDVTKQESADAAIKKAIDTWGHLDILVNNAGVSSAPGRSGDEDREVDWQVLWSINVMGVVHCCSAAITHMKQRRYGKIVNIASMAGHAARRSGGAYGVSKAAVLRYTKGLAYQLASFNINVNAICPGAVWTAFQQRGVQRRVETNPELAKRDPHELFLENYKTVIPLGREQTPEDIGKTAAFIASEDARNITGQCFHVDGGAILRD